MSTVTLALMTCPSRNRQNLSMVALMVALMSLAEVVAMMSLLTKRPVKKQKQKQNQNQKQNQVSFVCYMLYVIFEVWNYFGCGGGGGEEKGEPPPPPPPPLLAAFRSQLSASLGSIDAASLMATTTHYKLTPLPNPQFPILNSQSSIPTATSPQPPPLLFQLALLGSDNQTTVMSFLKPFDVYAYMTSPLSNLFRTLLTLDDDIWRRLCCSAPFNHNTRQEPQSLVSNGHFAKFGKWRGLYMNMFKCFEFLSQTTARNIARLNENSSAIVPDYVFLCKRDSKTKMEDAGSGSGSGSGRENKNAPLLAATRTKTRTRTTTLPVLDRIKTAPSSITARLFAAPANQTTTTTTNTSTTMALEHINKAFLLSPSRLPWTSTMYTIHNWLSFYFNVVGIQEACLSALPCLLEKDSQREDAMRIHLTDLVLKAMVRFPNVITVNNAGE